MKICIIQRSGIEESPVICELSSVLIQEGCETFLLIQEYERDLFQAIRKIGVDVLAVQSEIGDEGWVRDMISELRDNFPRIPVVSFGSIPTFLQKEANLGADFLVVGEPEIPFVSLVRYLKGVDEELMNVIDMRNGGQINIKPLEFDLNSLPMPDREIYYRRYKFLRDFPVKRFIMSRGCVLSCSFCYISGLRNLLGKVKVRFKTPERVIQEVLDVRSKYRLDFVHFSDDLFPVWNKAWLESFSKLWKKQVNLPFIVITLANFINDSVCELMKDAGCRAVIMGIETHNEKRRIYELHKTSVTNSTITSAVLSLKKYNIKSVSFNIVGLPGENEDDWFKTADFNRELGVDLAIASIFTPIPGTYLGDLSLSEPFSVPRKLFYFRSSFHLISVSVIARHFFSLFLFNDLLAGAFSKVGEAYLAISLKNLYGISFLDALRYYLKVGTLSKRKTNLHQVA